MGINVVSEMRQKKALTEVVAEEETVVPLSIWKSLFWLLFGLAVLVASSRLLVWGAVEIARALGVSDLLIGLTIVAVGTSLPELASSIAAARRGENDLAVGNVIGSNIFNTLVVVGLASVIAPIKAADPEVMSRDVPIMIALTLLLFFICIPFKKKNGKRVSGFGRIGGALFLSLYIAYLVLLGIQAV
jgi:cation:H+ antiporter